MPVGRVPTLKVPRVTPSLARTFVTLAPKKLEVQILAPSKVIHSGPWPTGNVPRLAPSLARSFVTVLSAVFVTQMLAPSKTGKAGTSPTGKFCTTNDLRRCAFAGKDKRAVRLANTIETI